VANLPHLLWAPRRQLLRLLALLRARRAEAEDAGIAGVEVWLARLARSAEPWQAGKVWDFPWGSSPVDHENHEIEHIYLPFLTRKHSDLILVLVISYGWVKNYDDQI